MNDKKWFKTFHNFIIINFCIAYIIYLKITLKFTGKSLEKYYVIVKITFLDTFF